MLINKCRYPLCSIFMPDIREKEMQRRVRFVSHPPVSYVKVCWLNAALFDIYYFCYIEQTAVRHMGIILTNM
jgi:hypothetical protein